jgi:hypothetical protein
MAVLERIKTVDGGSQMRAEFINNLWSVPVSRLTGVENTIARTPIDYFAAWKQMVGIDLNLHAANNWFPLQKYSTDCALVAVQESRQGHRLVVLTTKPYRVIDIQPGAIDRACVVTWEEV